MERGQGERTTEQAVEIGPGEGQTAASITAMAGASQAAASPAALESLLFVAEGPVEPADLAKALGTDRQAVEAGLEQLETYYVEGERGLRLARCDGRVQLVTAPEAAGWVEEFLNLDSSTRLSGPALEVLAVIAYRQPVTRAQVEAVRGVDCSGVLRSLLQRGLVGEAGRLETVGRPILYGVTDLFMQHFGLTSLKELPPLEVKEQDMLWAATKLAEIEEGRSGEGGIEGQ